MNIERITFNTFVELEEYFINKVIPRKGVRSKVIGKTILIWRKKWTNY